MSTSDQYNKVFQVISESELNMVSYQVSELASVLDQDKRFVQLNVKKYIRNDVNYTLIQIIDVSKRLLYNKISAKQEFLQLINSTISHETRNPLNSIVNQVLNLENIVN
mmetsp:Transcript_41682/g.63696  ORF Transcript_41682/g.63696 Transcript_41682/m.63696 type:complete len:109 (-) Transcript_41682:1514-1840(-)